MFKKRLIVLIALLMISTAVYAVAQDDFVGRTSNAYIVDLQANDNKIFLQPNGPFAVMAFDEFALATHIGVVYFKQMGSPVDGTWNISERFWQNSKWGSDVTSILWSPDGKYLFVATSMVYGEGAVFKLHLMEKTFTKIFPNNDEKFEYLKIIGFDSERNILKIDTAYQNKDGIRDVSME